MTLGVIPFWSTILQWIQITRFTRFSAPSYVPHKSIPYYQTDLCNKKNCPNYLSWQNFPLASGGLNKSLSIMWQTKSLKRPFISSLAHLSLYSTLQCLSLQHQDDKCSLNTPHSYPSCVFQILFSLPETYLHSNSFFLCPLF